MYYCYIIKNGKYSYCGATTDVHRRLLQHNGHKSGGAKYTTSKLNLGQWSLVCYVEGFAGWSHCLRFEYRVKHCNKTRSGGINNRIKKLYKTLNEKKRMERYINIENDKLKLNWIDNNVKTLCKTKNWNMSLINYIEEYDKN
jgi:predicted GIY-YIG superfamily endonuclease